ncbi:MAG: ankyrin repeat domain-containing protein [Bacteroidales bacterium]|nr:ankyrin repeat domain-containing protein [Bacteroidales bacterium]
MKNNKVPNVIFITVMLILTGLYISTNLSAQEDWGQDPLYSATIRADIEGVKEALASGADINRQTENGYSSLMWACTYSQKAEYAEVAKYLISAGADVNKAASDGTTALLEAAESSEEITKLLLEKGADINARRNDGRGIFTSVIFGLLMQNVDIEFAEFILSQGADVNETATSGDVEGWAAIHYAVSNGKEDLVKFLVNKGADVNAKTIEGLTPLSLAEANEYSGIIEVLKAAGAK